MNYFDNNEPIEKCQINMANRGRDKLSNQYNKSGSNESEGRKLV